MIVRFAPEAEVDLIETADWIAPDNPQRTASFVRELRDRCFNPSDFPHAFPVVPELREEKSEEETFDDTRSFIEPTIRRLKSCGS